MGQILSAIKYPNWNISYKHHQIAVAITRGPSIPSDWENHTSKEQSAIRWINFCKLYATPTININTIRCNKRSTVRWIRRLTLWTRCIIRPNQITTRTIFYTNHAHHNSKDKCRQRPQSINTPHQVRHTSKANFHLGLILYNFIVSIIKYTHIQVVIHNSNRQIVYI